MIDHIYIDGEIVLYGTVGLTWWGEGFSALDVVEALAAHGKGKDITVRINSGGGIAFDGQAIYSSLRGHAASGAKVTTIVDGLAASAASLIFMAGDTRQMRPGSMLMIHDASGVTFGNAEEHEKTAEVLNKISDSYRDLYAATTGKEKDAIRTLMLAETWFTAEEARAEAFATEVLGETPAVAAAAFDYRIYARAPDGIRASQRNRPDAVSVFTPVAQASAAATQPKEPVTMAANTPAPVAGAPTEPVVTPAVKAWLPGFYASAEKSGLTIAAINTIAQDSETLDVAQSALIDAMASASAPKPAAGAPALVTADASERFHQGFEKALLAKAGVAGGERNEFSSLTLREGARASLEARGVRKPFASAQEMVRAAFMAAPGHHATSDFPLVLGNVARKSLLRGFDEQPETFSMWTSVGSATDFKPATAAGVGNFSNLVKVEEGGEYTYGTFGERGQTIAIAKYGRLFSITWEAVMNDDLGALTRIPRRMGSAARRQLGSLAYGVLTANAALADGIALFHANHFNLATGGGSALSTDSVQAGLVAMAKQKDPLAATGQATALNIQPKYLIVPVALRFTAEELVSSVTKLGQSNPQLKNPLLGKLEVVSDPRLDEASTTAWYLAADPAAVDTVEMTYLDGHEKPETFEEPSFNVDGTSYKVRQVAGANTLDFRGLYKAAGA